MSVWTDLHKRSTGEAIRKEDKQIGLEIKELKQKVKAAAKQYVEEYIDAMFEAEYTVKGIQEQYKWALMNVETYYIVDRMEKVDQDRFWELQDHFWDLDEEFGLGEEVDLEDYAQGMLKHFADILIPALKDDEEEE